MKKYWHKHSRRFLSFIMALALMFSVSATCFASAAEETSGPLTAAFYALPDDAIVCYMYGQPVYKYEVDNYGIVHKDFSLPNLAMTSTSSDGTMAALPLNHRNERVASTYMIYMGMGYETHWDLYVPNQFIEDAADELRAGADLISFVSLLTGGTGTFVGGVLALVGGVFGPVLVTAGTGLGAIGFVWGLDSIARKNLADAMEAQASDGNDVKISYVVNTYGAFVNATNWDGINCVKNSTLFVTVTDVFCSHGVNPWD